ncbi:hypothetical protein BANRA_01697 [Acinetobacter baumannii]|nr:hypothetical protein BANRA_01697 [Acinetobacter baumannii]
MSANLKKNSQWLWVGVIAAITAILIGLLVLNSKINLILRNHRKATGMLKKRVKNTMMREKTTTTHCSANAGTKFKIEQAELGEVPQLQTYPAKLVVNTDRQAHVSPSFSGRVEAVYVELGQQVKRPGTCKLISARFSRSASQFANSPV